MFMWDIDRFKSLHNSGRFINTPQTNGPAQLYSAYQVNQMYPRAGFNPVRAWGDNSIQPGGSSSSTNGQRTVKQKVNTPFGN